MTVLVQAWHRGHKAKSKVGETPGCLCPSPTAPTSTTPRAVRSLPANPAWPSRARTRRTESVAKPFQDDERRKKSRLRVIGKGRATEVDREGPPHLQIQNHHPMR